MGQRRKPPVSHPHRTHRRPQRHQPIAKVAHKCRAYLYGPLKAGFLRGEAGALKGHQQDGMIWRTYPKSGSVSSLARPRCEQTGGWAALEPELLLSSNRSQLPIRSGLFSAFVPLKSPRPLSTNESITFDCESLWVPVMSPFVCTSPACGHHPGL